jgi:hypothetical protein
MEKEIAHRVGAGNVRAPAILGSFAHTLWKGKRIYTWTDLHLIRELLRTSGLKEGAAGATGEKSPLEK